ncbi:hypothetical protein ACBG90_21955 [Stutzerimonas kunmingensis]
MLHAISRKKTCLHHRYLGHREEGERRVMEEDELTATLMGPLAFFPASAVSALWREIIGPRTDWPEGEPVRAGVEFWPSRVHSGRRIEPDLLVSLHWRDGTRRLLLVEFKWRAPLSGERQLHRQWLDFLSDEERETALHLFIAPEVSQGLGALAEEDVWGRRLLLRTWQDILNSAETFKGAGQSPLAEWAVQIEKVLGLLGISAFGGFLRLGPPSLPEPHRAAFWHGTDIEY